MTQENNKKNISGKYPEVVQKYLRELGELPVLTMEEEKELARRIKEGDEEAKKKLANANLMLVVKIAKYYTTQNKKLGVLDLIQEGNLALYRAAELYDWKSDYRFPTFATLVIEMDISDALANRGKAALRNLLRKALHKGLEEKEKRVKKGWKLFQNKIDYPHDYLSKDDNKKEREKYTREEKIDQVAKIKNYVRKNISESITLLLVTKMFSRPEAKKEIKQFLK